MTWFLPALVSSATLLWVDALAGGRLVSAPLCLLLLATLAVGGGLRARPVPLVVAATGAVALAVLADRNVVAGRFSAANDSVFYAVVVAAPAAVGWLLGERRRRIALLREQTDELTRRRTAAALAARAAERERIERQMDGALAQRLRAITSGVRDASAMVDGDRRVPGLVAAVETTARAALDDLRAALGAISAVASPSPLAPALSVPIRPLPRWLDVLLCLSGIPLAVELGPSWPDVLLALLQGAALCAVWRRPLLGTLPLVALALLQTAAFAPLPPTVSWLLIGLLLTFLSSLRVERRLLPAGLLLLAVELAAITLASPPSARSLDGVVPSAVLALLTVAAARLVRGADLRACQLQATMAELERTADVSAVLAAADQRAEIAHELHDVGAHSLTVVCLQAAAVQALWERDPQQARSALASMRTLADDNLGHLTASLSGLAEQPSDQPLEPASVELLAQVSRALGLDVTVEARGAVRPLNGRAAHAAFRVVQESLTNAARHAPGATVVVALDYSGDALALQVRDFGAARTAQAAHVPGSRLGLKGMQERVNAVGGTMTAGPLGAGFAVAVRLPLESPAPLPPGTRRSVLA